MSQVVNIRSLFATLVVALTIGFASAQTGFTPPEPDNGSTGGTATGGVQSGITKEQWDAKVKELDDKIAAANQVAADAAAENERFRSQVSADATARVAAAKRRYRAAQNTINDTLTEFRTILAKYGKRIWVLEYRTDLHDQMFINEKAREAATSARIKRLEDLLIAKGMMPATTPGTAPATGAAPGATPSGAAGTTGTAPVTGAAPGGTSSAPATGAGPSGTTPTGTTGTASTPGAAGTTGTTGTAPAMGAAPAATPGATTPGTPPSTHPAAATKSAPFYKPLVDLVSNNVSASLVIFAIVVIVIVLILRKRGGGGGHHP